MIFPSFTEFKKKAQSGNLIPVYEEILADLETPVSAFMKISQGNKYSFLLESVEGGEKIAHYTFLGSRPALVFKSQHQQGEIITSKGIEKFACPNPLLKVKEILATYQPVEDKNLPRFIGGAVGYLSYDLVRLFENIPDENPDHISSPDCIFLFTDTILIFDHLKHKIKIVANAQVEENIRKSYGKACQKIEEIKNILSSPLREKRSLTNYPAKNKKIKYRSNFKKEEFKAIVKKAKDYIRAGDIIQTVLSQRLEINLKCHPFEIYRALRTINPSPYMYYLNLDDLKILGSSPELLVRLEKGVVEARPIAGTRPRSQDEKKDQKLAEELLKDEKERAEHIMLVDLARNDLGRICHYQTVKVKELMVIEKYSHVMHLVSSVVGKIRPEYSAYDVLAACFPAGTVSGAPKIRAMEIIDELENVRRGIYAGAIGYFSFSGNMDTCITIRTLVVKNNKGYIQAGAGIVADSKPTKEYFETLNKAKVILKAIEMARGGKERGKI